MKPYPMLKQAIEHEQESTITAYGSYHLNKATTFNIKNLDEKLDLFLKHNRITQKEYDELRTLTHPEEAISDLMGGDVYIEDATEVEVMTLEENHEYDVMTLEE